MRLAVTGNPISTPNHIYLTFFKEWLAQQNMTGNTRRAYHSRVRQFLLFLEYANLSERRLDHPDGLKEAANQYLTFLKKSKKMVRSVNANINALISFSRFLGLKCAPFKRVNCYPRTTNVLTLEEQERFLRSVERQEHIRDKALGLMLFYTGVRIGDCAHLNVGDIGARGATIRFGNQMVALNEQTATALRQWLEQRQRLTSPESNVALWLTKQGQRLSISGITFVIRRIGRQAKLGLSAELLRRTYLASANCQSNARQSNPRWFDVGASVVAS